MFQSVNYGLISPLVRYIGGHGSNRCQGDGVRVWAASKPAVQVLCLQDSWFIWAIQGMEIRIYLETLKILKGILQKYGTENPQTITYRNLNVRPLLR